MIISMMDGFVIGLSLILAIGAQNAFVLKQGLVGQHVLPIVLICVISDSILIILGVNGFGILAERLPLLEPLMRYGGAAFIAVYGLISLRRAFLGSEEALDPASGRASSLRAAVMTCLAFTWLNPHVYLDTVVLIGSLSTQSASQLGFTIGAVFASFCFFFSLGYGAKYLGPYFSSAAAWRRLDAVIGVIMLLIALKLIFS